VNARPVSASSESQPQYKLSITMRSGPCIYIDMMKQPHGETAPINSKNSSWLLFHLTQTACHYIPNIYIYTLDPKKRQRENNKMSYVHFTIVALCVSKRKRKRRTLSLINAEQRINELNLRCIGIPLYLLGRLKPS